MSGQNGTTPVGQILLARLLVAGEKGATGTDIRKALEPLLGHRWAGTALAERLEQARAELESAGLATRTGKGKSERSVLTPEGRRAGLEALGIEHLPPGSTWDKVKKTYLAARALGLPSPTGKAATQFSGDPGFKAALLKARFSLPLDDYPTIQQALDALSWTLLRLEPGPAFSVKNVQAALILRALGESGGLAGKPDPKKEVTRLLAREVGARQSGKDELRTAALRNWADGGPVGEDSGPPRGQFPAPAGIADAAPALDLNAFARRVVEAARTSPTGRFGDNKVFVAHVWRALGDDPVFLAMGADGFKSRLAEANNARLLDLSRADLVEAMDPDDVRRSEVSYLGATFHFVRI